KPYRSRRRSKSPISPISDIREREEILKDIAGFTTKKERRLRITPKEKITENKLCL
ncbi:hypothetical protein V2W45_1253391, partial [Cenococcum geophilum]